MITKEELNPSIRAFLRNDWSFNDYISKRTESNEDLNLINDVLKNDGDTSNLPSDKMVMNQMFKTPNEKVQEMIKMSADSDLLRYVGTKVCTKMYDNLIQDKMKQEHDAEKKPEEERTDTDNRKLSQLKFKMGIQINKMADKATEEFEKVVVLNRAIGKANEHTSTPQDLNPEKLMDIASKSSEMLNKILKLVGHFQGCFDHKLRTKSDAIENLCGIKMGNEIQNLLPSEMMMMMDKDFESLKTLEFIKRNTMQYKFKGKSPQTGGPIVCCIDESLSMSGDRIELAKAFCFGLFQQAKAENREFQIIRFGDYTCIKAVIKDGFDLLEVSKQFLADGGTDFERPLSMAMDVIRSDNKYDKADIVMITDGMSRVSPGFIKDFNDFKKSTNTKLITLSIIKWNKDYGLGKMSDKVVFGADFDRLVDIM